MKNLFRNLVKLLLIIAYSNNVNAQTFTLYVPDALGGIENSGTDYVGIGIENPNYELHLHDMYRESAYLQITHKHTGEDAYDGGIIGMSHIMDLYIANKENASILFQTNGTNTVIIDKDGKVGIGTITPDYMLEVDGTIKAEEIIVDDVTAQNVKVSIDNVADYVFEDGYNLKSITEMEEYITTHKHLPGIPSAEELEAQGMDVATMTNLLLEKIEELTLYIIEQEKRIGELENEVIQ